MNAGIARYSGASAASAMLFPQRELRRIDGWRKIGTVLSQHTAVTA